MSEISFLILPGEIRNQIYTLLLLIENPPSAYQTKPSTPLIYPQILVACRQTHDEGAAILYGMNMFVSNESLLTSMPRLRSWYLPCTSERYIRMIRRYHMRVRLDCDERFVAVAAQLAFSGLDELTVDVFQGQFGSSNHERLKSLEGVRGVKKARLLGSITGFAVYAHWLESVMMSPEGTMPQQCEDAQANDMKNFDKWSLST